MLQEQPLWEMTVVYSNWLWWYECWKIPVKKHLASPAVNKPPSKQRRSSHNRWAMLTSPLFQHWGDIKRLIALDYRCALWILITPRGELLQLGFPPSIITDGQWIQNFRDHTAFTSVCLCKPWRLFIFPLWHIIEVFGKYFGCCIRLFVFPLVFIY